ncbi:predicted protein [Sclerotinia sclerotiorum 1980 UF-70]|uniref:Uncharacterized protein n=1 Tax=Sclerotinia sclerotiorum (strain ATCC 18683 / 1980 / Ss-1) TaxID=665079 RepID=A7EBT9_SCLS1|nr:predicted protein [Sclerotinia sclerotiorum 1980 UF-70]EDN99917.1 predicted protein [Sclerotinia sclerotiorum 1980 UF-70]
MITKNFHKNFASSLTRASGLRLYNLEIFEKIDPYDPDEDIQTTCRSIHAWISDISHALVFQLI